MAEFDDRLPTYITAHRGKYEALGGAIVHTLQTWDSSKVAAQETDATPVQIQRGYDAAVLMQHLDISPQDAQELADAHDRRLRQLAGIAFSELQSLVTMDRLRDYIGKHPEVGNSKKPIPWRKNKDNSKVLHYADATYAIVDANPTNQHYVELTRTRLGKLEGGGSAERYTVNIENNGLTQRLAIVSLDRAINHLRFRIQATEDELIERAMRVLGTDHFSQLTTILARSISEDEINTTLNEIWADHQGQSTEEEVGPLLEQLRDRVLGAQQARDMSYEHGAELPSMEKLNEIGRLFGMRF